jgi:hypothetical protein
MLLTSSHPSRVDRATMELEEIFKGTQIHLA